MKSFDRLIYFSALAFAFLMPLSRAAVSFFVIWFILLFLIRNDYKNTWECIKSQRALLAMGSFVGFLYLSILWSGNLSEGLHQMRLYAYWIIIPILAVILKREWLSNLVTAFLSGMFVSEILSYGIYFGLWTINGRTPDYPTPFMSHIHYSIFLATTSILLLSRLLSKSYTWKSKLPMFLFFLTATGNLFLSTGRTGQLAFLIALGVAVLLHYRLTLKSILIFILMSGTLFIGAYATIDLFKHRVDSAIEDVHHFQEGNLNTSWGLRSAFWVITYDILREHPLVGAGIGDYRDAAVDVLTSNPHHLSPGVVSWCGSTHFHNQYLTILAQIGLVGFTLMIWMIIELFRVQIDNEEIRMLRTLGLTVFLVGSIAEPLWILQFPIILYIFIVSLSLAGETRRI